MARLVFQPAALDKKNVASKIISANDKLELQNKAMRECLTNMKRTILSLTIHQ